VAFFVLPFAAMAMLSLWQRTSAELVPAWSLSNYAAILGEPAAVRAILNAVEITLTVTVLSVVLAFPLARIIAEEVPPRWRRLALAPAVLPFWTSCVVRSHAWSLVLARQGVVNGWPSDLSLPALDLASSRAARVIGFTHFFTMLPMLTIHASLVQLHPNPRRAAADLLSRFRRDMAGQDPEPSARGPEPRHERGRQPRVPRLGARGARGGTGADPEAGMMGARPHAPVRCRNRARCGVAVGGAVE
jgi:ABC-type spermidine/putrescine transport system permease subunit I